MEDQESDDPEDSQEDENLPRDGARGDLRVEDAGERSASPAEGTNEGTPDDIFREESEHLLPPFETAMVHSAPLKHSILALMELDAPRPPAETKEEISQKASVADSEDEDNPLGLKPAVLVRHHVHEDDHGASLALPGSSHHQHELDKHRHAFEQAAAAIQPVAIEESNLQPEAAPSRADADARRVPEDRPSTPQRDVAHSPSPTPDPTRHYHGNRPPTAQARMPTSSPAGRTRSRCVYHKVQFVDDLSNPVLLVPGCTVDTSMLELLNAQDVGEATADEMSRGISLRQANDDSQRRTVLPEGIEGRLRHMVGIDIFREGHSYVLPTRTHARIGDELATADEHDVDRATSPKARSRRGSSNSSSSPLTPNRKRKRNQPSPVEEEDQNKAEDGSPLTKRQAIDADEKDMPMEVDSADGDRAIGPAKPGMFSSLWPGNWWGRTS